MKTMLVEIHSPLSCPEFAQVGRELPRGKCPRQDDVIREVNAQPAPDEWTDHDVDAWVTSCPDAIPVDEHDHRFIWRMALRCDDTVVCDSIESMVMDGKTGRATPLAMSHYEGIMHRTKNPREFDNHFYYGQG